MMSFAFSSSGSAPLHIIFCLDESGSMGSNWASLVDAVMQFLDIRKACAAADMDLISIIKFAERSSLLWDKVAVEYAISNRSAMVHKGGGTNFLPALRMVKQQMVSEPSGMGVAVVFLTDGETTRSNEAAPSVGRLQNGFMGSSFQFFGVFFRAGATQTAGEGVLQDMVDAAGKGKMVLATNVDELKTQFQTIAREVSASYAR
jgi:uncharacterized protein YegL